MNNNNNTTTMIEITDLTDLELTNLINAELADVAALEMKKTIETGNAVTPTIEVVCRALLYVNELNASFSYNPFQVAERAGYVAITCDGQDYEYVDAYGDIVDADDLDLEGSRKYYNNVYPGPCNMAAPSMQSN